MPSKGPGNMLTPPGRAVAGSTKTELLLGVSRLWGTQPHTPDTSYLLTGFSEDLDRPTEGSVSR